MKFSFLFIIMVSAFASCNLVENKSGKKSSKDMTYSYKCLDSAIGGSETNKAITRTTNIIRDLTIKEKDITDAVQNEYGEAFHKDALETKTFVLLQDAA